VALSLREDAVLVAISAIVLSVDLPLM